MFVLAGTLANLGPVGNNDIGFHLRLGQEIAAHGPPFVDNHSFTAPGVPYPDHEWIAQLGLWAFYSAVGVPGLAVLQGVLIGATLALVLYAVRAPVLLRILAALPVLLLGFDHSEIRPHLLGWIYIAVLGLLLEGRRYVWMLALLLVWANTHGSLPLGVGLAGLHLMEQAAKEWSWRPLWWAVPVVLVPLLNPYGTNVYTLFLTIRGNADFVGEWKPYAASTWEFWLLVGLVGWAIIGMMKHRFNPFDAFRLFVLGVLSFQSSRTGVVMAIWLAPFFGRWFEADVRRWGSRTQLGAAVVLTLCALGLLGQRWREGRAMRLDLDPQHLPVAAVQFIQDHHLTGPVYNDYNFGGYLLWKAPELPVFVDGRIEVYQGKVLDDSLRISGAAPGWPGLVERYGVRLFLVRSDRTITKALLADPAWDLVYFDYNAAVFVPRDAPVAVRRLRVISPTGNRESAGSIDQAISEMRYLLAENPLFFGGFKVLAFLEVRRADFPGAAESVHKYLALHPAGRSLADTAGLIDELRQHGAWSE